MKLLPGLLIGLSLLFTSINMNAQNVGIGTATPITPLHVTLTDNTHKTVIYGYADQTASFDYYNTAITGFGQGNGTPGVTGFGFGIGVRGIGSINGYGGIGLYGSTAEAIFNPSIGNNYYALYADVFSPALNKYAGVFLNGNVGIGTRFPDYPLHVFKNQDVWHTSIGGTTGNLLIGGQTANGAVLQSVTPGSNTARDLYIQRDGGNVGIGTNAPTEKLQVSGNVQVTGKVVRPATGAVNLLPIAVGNTNFSGGIVGGSGNFTVVKIGTGLYEITIAGESFSTSTHVCTATIILNTDMTINIFGNAGKINVATRYPGTGLSSDSGFSFIVYKLN